MRAHVTMQKAVNIAGELGDADFTTAVDSARSLGLQSVEIVTTDSDGASDIYVQRPTGLMIAWKPRRWTRERVAIPGGELADDIHLTVLYLGDAANFDTDQQRTIIGVVSEVAQRYKQIRGEINGFGRFLTPDENNQNALWLGGDYQGLNELRDDLASTLQQAGIEWEDKFPSYVPHITVAYVDAEAETPQVIVAPFSVCIDNLTVCIGGLEYEIDLDDLDYDDGGYFPPVDEEAPNVYYPALLTKRGDVLDDEKRYSYGAWYVPNSVDAHNEWATPDTVQEALWKYVDSGDREVRLMHQPEIVAGRWVELATFPFPVSVPVETQPGILRKHTYPAGTPFMGTIWEEWAWPLVKSGDLAGFSVGGTAQRMEAEFHPEALQKVDLRKRGGD